MSKESFILVSLEDKKSKELAKVISSDTSRRILEYLGGQEELAESQIARVLKIPLSTVHYNVQHLLKAGLIEVKDFAWSEKGKKVELYTVSKKIVIMAPKGSEGFLDKIKGLVPVALLSFGVAAALYLVSRFKDLSNLFLKFTYPVPGDVVSETASAPVVKLSLASKAAPQVAQDVVNITVNATTDLSAILLPRDPNYALWFFFGSLLTLILFVIYMLIKRIKAKAAV